MVTVTVVPTKNIKRTRQQILENLLRNISIVRLHLSVRKIKRHLN